MCFRTEIGIEEDAGKKRAFCARRIQSGASSLSIFFVPRLLPADTEHLGAVTILLREDASKRLSEVLSKYLNG